MAPATIFSHGMLSPRGRKTKRMEQMRKKPKPPNLLQAGQKHSCKEKKTMMLGPALERFPEGTLSYSVLYLITIPVHFSIFSRPDTLSSFLQFCINT